MSFNIIEFIETKRDHGTHDRAAFHSLITELMRSKIPHYQLSAWLMAAFLNGLDDDETVALTEELAHSGEVYTYPPELRVVDKHSTGGVGDKTTLILLPLAASCGVVVSKLSGRGLGITGGTVDKLEAIPGMNMHLTPEHFLKQVKEIGCAVSGHSKQLAPAEGLFYAMRDVTGTVPSIPLITTSIVSKKLAGGAQGFVFDVKAGSGAFMKTEEEARALAQKLVLTSKMLGKSASAVITNMDQPLGEWVGNAAEVREAIEILSGKGPADTRELCITLCAYMLLAAGLAENTTEAMEKAQRKLDDGSALKKFAELIKAQGGDPTVLEKPLELLPLAETVYEIKAEKNGFVTKINAEAVGEALRALGGGRMKIDDTIDMKAAIRLPVKQGEPIKAGERLLELYCDNKEKTAEAMKYLSGCITIAERAEKPKLILEIVE